MRVRFLPLFALLVCAAVPVAARAQDEAPSLIVRVRSIDSLIADTKYLATMIGQEEVGKQIDGFIKSMVGDKGLEGIDTKKPIGFYGTVGANFVDSTGVLMIPIADEKSFLALLDRLNLQVQKGDGGIYSFTPPNSPSDAYFRFANKYVYVSAPNKSAIDKTKLIDPATMFPAELSAAIAATVRFDRIPDAIKQLVLGQMELKVADESDKKLPNETETQRKFRVAGMKDFSRRVTQLFKEGAALTLRFDIDRKAHEITTELSLTGKANSKLATDIADLGQSKSLFGAALGADSAFNFLVHATLPPDLQKAINPVIDESVRQALEKEKDEVKRAQGKKFIEVLLPTLKGGELDMAFTMRGPGKDGLYALVAGVKVKDGAQIEKTFRDIVKLLKEEEQAKIKFDVDKVGVVKIHEFDVKKDLDDKAKELLGTNPLYVAVRGDAILFSAGEGGLTALKEAIAAKPQDGPQIQFEMSLKRIAPIMERDNKDALKFLEEAFGKATDNDRIRFTVAGGKSLKARFVMKTPVVKFFVLLGQAKNAEK